MSRQLIVLVVLLAVTGGTLALRSRASDDGPSVHLDSLSALIDGWIAADGVPQNVLPTDPRALQSLRRTYTRNGHSVMLSVAQYPSLNHPEHRPLAAFVVPTGDARRVAYENLTVNGTRPPDQPYFVERVNFVSLEGPNRRLAVAYWYQLDDTPITNEYALRFWLFADTLRNRPRAFTLIRLAAAQPGDLSEFLQTFYPRLRAFLVS